MRPRHRLALPALAGILASITALVVMGYQSETVMRGIAEPDVDEMLRRYRDAKTAGQGDEMLGRIRGMGSAGAARLRVIALDRGQDPAIRCRALWCLHGNPEALFDLLLLVDDPETSVRLTAREDVHYCLAKYPLPRDPRSDTESRLLKAWRETHAARGFSAFTAGDGIALQGREGDSSLACGEIFDRWLEGGTLASSSPHLLDLKARGNAAFPALWKIAETTDSPYRRRSAYIAVGMLGDTAAVPFLRKAMKLSRDPSEIASLRLALSFLESPEAVTDFPQAPIK